MVAIRTHCSEMAACAIGDPGRRSRPLLYSEDGSLENGAMIVIPALSLSLYSPASSSRYMRSGNDAVVLFSGQTFGLPSSSSGWSADVYGDINFNLKMGVAENIHFLRHCLSQFLHGCIQWAEIRLRRGPVQVLGNFDGNEMEGLETDFLQEGLSTTVQLNQKL